MPIIAIAAAVFAVVEIVEVGLAAMTVFEAIAAVGAVTSGVGVVTGNEDLQNVGQVMAIGGGLGMAATKIGALDWNPTVSEVTGIPTRAQDAAYLSNVRPEAAAASQTNPADTAAAAAGTNTSTVTGATPQAIAPPDAVGTINATDTTAGSIATTDAPAAAAPVAAAPVAAAPGSAASLNLESGLAPSAAVAPTSGMFAASTPEVPVTWFSAVKDYIAPFTEFAKENQMLTYGAMQAGGSVVAGLFDPLKPAQIKKAEAEADLLTSQKTSQDKQTANMAAAMPRAYRKPKVLPVQSSNKPVGLINASTA